MAIPIGYAARSVLARWKSTIVAILGIAGTVGVFIAVLAMAKGFRATMISSGSPDNAIILRGGADSEMESAISLDQMKVISDAAGIAHSKQGLSLASGEVVVIASFPLASSGTTANVQVRGVGPMAMQVRPSIKIPSGRFITPGRLELVIGRNVQTTYSGFALGRQVHFGGGNWKVVGIFDAGGSAFDSEIWCDAKVLNQIYKRPQNIVQSVTVRMNSYDGFRKLKDFLTTDPRLTVSAEREQAYYKRKSLIVTTMIGVLGTLVALVMAIGAIFAALNTMYSAVASRVREIATLRALGFMPPGIMFAFLGESVMISAAGGLLGCLAALPLNGLTTGTINWATFSHLAFGFRVTPGLLGAGILFALFMGLIGGFLPAVRAARLPVATALREL